MKAPSLAHAMTLDEASLRLGHLAEAALLEAVRGRGVLHDAMAYHLATGGKRLRAILPAWVATNLGGTASQVQAAVGLGVALELVHNGTLVHDDVQDGDEVRRGQPAVWRAFGLPQAINVGSWMMLAGTSEALSVGGASAAEVLQRALLRVIEGQALEFTLQAESEPTVAAWEIMARAKTGALFGAAFALGGLAAGRAPTETVALAALGEDLGLFFQLQDDLLDLLGDKGRGAPATDLAEGKISHPVAWLAEHGDAVNRARTLEVVRKPRGETSRADVEDALACLAASGALKASISTLARLGDDLGRGASDLVPGLVGRVLAPLAHVLPPGVP
jgi:geranylgeranyl diphosphate synthase type I